LNKHLAVIWLWNSKPRCIHKVKQSMCIALLRVKPSDCAMVFASTGMDSTFTVIQAEMCRITGFQGCALLWGVLIVLLGQTISTVCGHVRICYKSRLETEVAHQ